MGRSEEVSSRGGSKLCWNHKIAVFTIYQLLFLWCGDNIYFLWWLRDKFDRFACHSKLVVVSNYRKLFFAIALLPNC